MSETASFVETPSSVETIPNDLFYTLLRDWERGPNKPLRVLGPVDLNSIEFRSEIHLENVEFEGALDLAHARFGASLTLKGCIFHHGVNAKNLEVKGDLSFDSCSFAGSMPSDTALLNLEAAEIHGTLSITRIHNCPGAISIADADIRANLRISDCLLGAFAAMGTKNGNATSESATSADDEVQTTPKAHDPSSIVLRLDRSNIGGSCKLGGAIELGALSTLQAPREPKLIIFGGVSADNIAVTGELLICDRFDTSGAKSTNIIHGSLSCSGAELGGELRLTSLIIRGLGDRKDPHLGWTNATLSIAGTNCASVVVRSVECTGDFDASHLCAKESVIVWECNVTDTTGATDVPGTTNSSEEQKASFNCARLETGKLTCGLLKVSGNISVENSTTGTFGIQDSELSGSLTADSALSNSMILASVRVAQDFNCNNASIDAMFVTDMEVSGQANLIGISCKNLIRLISERNEYALTVGRSLDLTSCEIGGQLDMSSSKIGDALLFNGSSVGSFLTGNEGGQNRFGALNIVDSHFTSYVRLLGLRVGAVHVDDVRPRSPGDDGNGSNEPGITRPKFLGCSISNSRFLAGLLFWRERLGHAAYGRTDRFTAWSSKDCLHCEVGSQFEIVDCQINGDLDLTRLIVHPDRDAGVTGANGGIRLDRTAVTGDLDFKSPQRIITGADRPTAFKSMAKKWIDAASTTNVVDGLRNMPRALASFLQLNGLAATNIDLTGLDLRSNADLEEDVTVHRAGFVFAERLQVPGRLVCYSEIRSSNVPFGSDWVNGLRNNEHQRYTAECDAELSSSRFLYEAFIGVPGALLLERASIGDLVVSACSFNTGTGDAKQTGIVLEHAKISHLWIPRIKRCQNGGGFPVPLDLSGLEVDAWTFDLDDDAHIDKDEAAAKSYIRILKNDKLHRDLYRAVYDQLRNSGNEREARKVFVAEHKRAFLNETRAFQARWQAWLQRPAPVSPADPLFGSLQFGLEVVRTVLLEMPFSAVYALRTAGRGSWDRFNRHFLSYGVNPLNLFWLICAFSLMTFGFVAREPGNFELSDASRLAVAEDRLAQSNETRVARGIGLCDDGVVLGPTPDEWGVTEAFWMTVRYHIPLVGLVVRAEYEPTDDRPAAYSWLSKQNIKQCFNNSAGKVAMYRQAGPEKGWFTPEDWFSAMALINWLFWPVLLTFALRRAFRESGR